MGKCPIDFATRTRQLRRSRKKTRHHPGTEGKIAVMALRLERGEHLHRDDDPPMDDEQVVRVAKLDRYRRKILGWRILAEDAYRQEGGAERHWGGEGERAKRPGWQRNGYRRKHCRRKPPVPFAEDPQRSKLWNERQRLLRAHQPSEGPNEDDWLLELLCPLR